MFSRSYQLAHRSVAPTCVEYHLPQCVRLETPYLFLYKRTARSLQQPPYHLLIFWRNANNRPYCKTELSHLQVFSCSNKASHKTNSNSQSQRHRNQGLVDLSNRNEIYNTQKYAELGIYIGYHIIVTEIQND